MCKDDHADEEIILVDVFSSLSGLCLVSVLSLAVSTSRFRALDVETIALNTTRPLEKAWTSNTFTVQ